jgi:hypothetical protein
MQITPNEIDSIEDAGDMNGKPVKLLRTKGGFWIAVGTPQGKMREEALAAGSHPAIVKYNLEKQYAAAYHPMLQKSEMMTPAVVVNHSKHLSEDLRKAGHDIYSIQTGQNIEFQITKHDIKVATSSATLQKDAMMVSLENVPREFSGALAGAALDKALASGVANVKIQGK